MRRCRQLRRSDDLEGGGRLDLRHKRRIVFQRVLQKLAFACAARGSACLTRGPWIYSLGFAPEERSSGTGCETLNTLGGTRMHSEVVDARLRDARCSGLEACKLLGGVGKGSLAP